MYAYSGSCEILMGFDDIFHKNFHRSFLMYFRKFSDDIIGHIFYHKILLMKLVFCLRLLMENLSIMNVLRIFVGLLNYCRIYVKKLYFRTIIVCQHLVGPPNMIFVGPPVDYICRVAVFAP